MIEYSRENYGAVILDMASPYGNWVEQIANLCDELLLVTTNELPALHSTQRAIAHLERIGLDKSSTAQHVVEIRVWRQLDLSGHQTVSRLSDCHRYHDCRLISDNVNLSTRDVDSQRAVRDQLLKSLQQQAHRMVWLSSGGGLGLLDAGLVRAADRLRERAC